ncbi:MAG: hypothetical protein J7L64_06280 [Acidobacteria bacterium]|nr:hypothetical protein [Acidobacteriota bacterium]
MRNLRISLILLVIALLSFGVKASSSEEGKAPLSLSSLYRIGNLLQDRNNDDVPDGINGVIVLPEKPSPAEIATGAEVALRLGFETTELDLPISATLDEGLRGRKIPIIISPPNTLLSSLGVKEELEKLSPGEGMVRLLQSKGKPFILIIGRDEEGLRRAGRGLSFRLPYLFSPKKGKISEVEKEVSSFLKKEKIAPKTVRTVKAIYGKGDELRRLSLEVSLKDEEDLKRANIILRELVSSHFKGKREKELSFPRLSELELMLSTKGKEVSIVIPRVGGSKKRVLPPLEASEGKKDFDLSTFYSLEGIYSDTKDKTGRGSLLPERTDTRIIFTETSLEIAQGVLAIASRIGLSATGIIFPIATFKEELKEGEPITNPIIVGKRDEPLIKSLIKKGRLNLLTLKGDEGLLGIVPKGWRKKETVLIATGKTDKGVRSACYFLAHRLPYLGKAELGGTTLEDVEEEALRFFTADEIGGKGATAGQLASAIINLKKLPLSGKPQIKLYLEAPGKGLPEKLSTLIEERFGQKVKVSTIRRKDPKPIFKKSFQIPWEGNELIRLVSQVSSKLSPEKPVLIFALVSEPPKVRAELSSRIERILLEQGIKKDKIKITILNAYKPGFSWLAYGVLPKLKRYKGKIKKIVISYQKFPSVREPYENKRARRYDKELPNRFLAELYPIDDVFAQELGISRDQVVFKEKRYDKNKPIYQIKVVDERKKEITIDSFSPPLKEQDYFRDYPDAPGELLPPFLSRNRYYGRVRVPTGFVEVKQGERSILKKRIKTDLERVWEIYQRELLPTFRNLVLKITGFPRDSKIKEKQPFFSLLRFDLALSESDFPVYPLGGKMNYTYRDLAPENPKGIRQERISSLEAISEDLYFVTLDFFKALGEELLGPQKPFTTPGLVLPVVHPDERYLGRAGRFSVSFNVNQADFPKMVVGQKEVKLSGVKFRDTDLEGRKLSLRLRRPSTIGLVIKGEKAHSLLLRLLVDDAEKGGEMVDALNLLKKQGIAQEVFNYPDLSRMEFLILDGKKMLTRGIKVAQKVKSVVQSKKEEEEYPVPLDRPIGYEESVGIMRKLARHPGVILFPLSESYQGRKVYGMTVTLPKVGMLRSIPKLITYKPTYFALGRQHANEVTSTNAILKLIELITSDKDYLKLLKKINLVAIPIENVDGTAIHDQLRKITPLWMLHAGRYNSVGVNVSYPKFTVENGRFVFSKPPKYREGLARLKMFRLFLPDVFGNNHTFPSHEWVQPFAGYAPPDFPSYLIPRALFYTFHGFLGTKRRIDDPAHPGKMIEIAIPDPDYPETLALAVGHREMITTLLANNRFRDPAGRTIDWWNEEFRKVYLKYGEKPLPKHFETAYYNHLLVYFPAKNKSPSSRSFMARFPNITGLEWVTETADETPYGAYCELASRAHLICDEATARMLATSSFEIKREGEEYRNGGRLTIYRRRPVIPANLPEKPWIISGEIKLKY